MTNPYSDADLKAIATEALMLTPEVAEMMRTTCLFERQRRLSPLNIDRLAHEMRHGTFVRGTPIFVAVLPDGAMRMLNGNHTCEAVRKTGIAIPVVFIYLKVRDIEDAAAIYSVLDTQKARTWTDALQARGINEEMPMARYVLSAVAFIMSGFRHDPANAEVKSRDSRFSCLETYRNPAGILAGAIANAPAVHTRKFRQVPVLAVALETARFQPSTAAEFWGGLVLDDGLPANDPRKALIRFLGNITGAGTTRWQDMARAAALAWNAHFEGRPLEICKPNQMGVFRIVGTPVGKETVARPAPATRAAAKAGSGQVLTKDGVFPLFGS